MRTAIAIVAATSLAGCSSPCGGPDNALLLGVAEGGGVDTAEQALSLETSMGEDGVWLRSATSGRQTRNKQVVLRARMGQAEIGVVRSPSSGDPEPDYGECDTELGLWIRDIFVPLSTNRLEPDTEVTFWASMTVFSRGIQENTLETAFRAPEILD